MARQPGLMTLTLSDVKRYVDRERADQWDDYAPIADIRITVRDPLAPLVHRYAVEARVDGWKRTLRATPTAMGQVCSIAGLPPSLLERIPPSLAPRLLHAMLETSPASDGRQRLLRLRDRRNPTLRAILPQSFVRLDDKQILHDLESAAGRDDLSITRISINDDILFLRVTLSNRLNLGTETQPDAGMAGIDIITSETGCHPLEMRYMLWRMICGNGLTIRSDLGELMKMRYTQADRPSLEAAVRRTLSNALHQGQRLADRVRDSRGITIEDPLEEIRSIFRSHSLGSPRGRIGRWVAQEVVRNINLFGVQRFDIVQAFTAVARGLDHRDRMKIEDAMGSYLIDGPGMN